jgi:proteasome activator subunit 4
MIVSIPSIASGFCITDHKDPRHQHFTALRKRFGEFLHMASGSLLAQGEENTVDAVQALVRAIRVYMLEYGDSRDR